MNDAPLPNADNVEAWSGKHRGAENFPVGVLIRPNLRRHVHAFYDFARNADDIGDSPALPPHDKLARLAIMQSVLLGERDTGSPSALALRASLAETGTPPTHALDLLHAFRQDATKTRYASWHELLDYCRYSAMPVGRHVLSLHGEPDATIAPSDSLCAVLQILNHLQDMAKDLAELDRCYLPADMLAEAGATVADLRRPSQTPALRRVITRLLDHCDTLNQAGAALPRHVRDTRLRLETAIIARLSQRLAARLRAGDPLATRVKLHPLDVASALLRAPFP
jgi:farnesyl-diphosphate farnesyltransferase